LLHDGAGRLNDRRSIEERQGRMSDVDLPLTPPLQPMLAAAVDDIPDEGELLFEPKWDGFLRASGK
jgi:ATP-dependent DNA ligase